MDNFKHYEHLQVDMDSLTLYGNYVILEIGLIPDTIDGVYYQEICGKKNFYGIVKKIGLNEISGKPVTSLYGVGDKVIFTSSSLVVEPGVYPYYRLPLSNIFGKLD